MNFKLSKPIYIYLALLTFGVGILQVLTPLFLRTFIDGIIPSKDEIAVFKVLAIIGLNELFLLLANSFLNKELDELEKSFINKYRGWMLSQVTGFNQTAKDAEVFYRSWNQDSKRLVYKKIKNPWYRLKDLIIVILLSFICINISFMAGFIVIVVASTSFGLVAIFKDDQGKDVRVLNQKALEEKKIYDETIKETFNSAEEKTSAIEKLNSLMESSNEQQYKVSYYRTKQQDINGFIKFILMFTILGIGGHLYATEKVSMGSLWALLITMYRINPPIQSLARWIMQSKGEVNLEERIMESLETKRQFIKPSYYNRLVKIIEKYLKDPTTHVVFVNDDIETSELVQSLQLWKSFYAKKESIEILEHDPSEKEKNKSYFLYNETNITVNGMYFVKKSDFTMNNTEGLITHELK